MAGALYRTAAIGPLYVGFIAYDGFNDAVGTLENPERPDEINPGAHRNARTAGIKQATKGRDHRMRA
jgi:hypothetical protein